MAEDLLEALHPPAPGGLRPARSPTSNGTGASPPCWALDYFRRIVGPAEGPLPPGRGPSATACRPTAPCWTTAGPGSWPAERFSVGLSLDGPAAAHDRLPRHPGRPRHPCRRRCAAFAPAAAARGALRRAVRAARGQRRRRPWRSTGSSGTWGSPTCSSCPWCSPPAAPPAAAPEAIGAFLCAVFDEWIRHDLGRMAVQTFDEAFRTACGLPHALCIFRETCGDVLVLEHEGQRLRLRPLRGCRAPPGQPAHRAAWREPGADPRLAAFGRRKRDGLPGPVPGLRRAGLVQRRLPQGPVPGDGGERALPGLPALLPPLPARPGAPGGALEGGPAAAGLREKAEACPTVIGAHGRASQGVPGR